MPFTKMPSGKYRSPSGRTFTGAQVRAYYAKKRKSPKQTPKANNRRRKPMGRAGMGG